MGTCLLRLPAWLAPIFAVSLISSCEPDERTNTTSPPPSGSDGVGGTLDSSVGHELSGKDAGSGAGGGEAGHDRTDATTPAGDSGVAAAAGSTGRGGASAVSSDGEAGQVGGAVASGDAGAAGSTSTDGGPQGQG